MVCNSDDFFEIRILTLIFLAVTGTMAGNASKLMDSSSDLVVAQLLKGYKRGQGPRDGATVVRLGIYINSFDSINEQAMDYSINIYLRQQWYDPRLKFNYSGDPSSPNMIKMEEGMWDKIWVPDVFFRNEKKASFHAVTVPQRLLFLHHDGRIWYVMKITATLSCPMRLKKYPLDTQKCPLMFESFGHTMDRLVYKWLENPKPVEKEALEMPQFRMTKYDLVDCSQNYTTGAYPCLQVIFYLKRDIGFYMIQVYIPSILIVILSWVSFWIDIDAVPARVPLGLLTVLTMTTQSAGATSHLPRVSYIKAIDVWMSTCLLFVFASLLEFALVNVYSRKEWHASLKRSNVKIYKEDDDIPLKEVTTSIPNGHSCSKTYSHHKFHEHRELTREYRRLQSLEGKQKARMIDKISRKVFPLSFLIFNIVYWTVYILIDDD